MFIEIKTTHRETHTNIRTNTHGHIHTFAISRSWEDTIHFYKAALRKITSWGGYKCTQGVSRGTSKDILREDAYICLPLWAIIWFLCLDSIINSRLHRYTALVPFLWSNEVWTSLNRSISLLWGWQNVSAGRFQKGQGVAMKTKLESEWELCDRVNYGTAFQWWKNSEFKARQTINHIPNMFCKSVVKRCFKAI